MINATQVRKGMILKVEEELYKVFETTTYHSRKRTGNHPD